MLRLGVAPQPNANWDEEEVNAAVAQPPFTEESVRLPINTLGRIVPTKSPILRRQEEVEIRPKVAGDVNPNGGWDTDW